MLTLKFLAAAIFIITGGAVFTGWFKNHRVLAVLAALVSIAAAYYFLRDVVRDVVREQVQTERVLPPAQRNDAIHERPASAQDEPVTSEGDVSPPSAEPVRPDPVASRPPSQSPDESTTNRNAPAPVVSRPRARRTFDALSIENLAHPEQSALVFPTAFFNRRLQQELGGISTPIAQIRLRVAFIEPRASRASARDGTVIGYFLVSFPNLPDCTRQFGGPSYAFPDANTGMMGAVNDAAPDVAHWIERASREEVLTCPD